MTDLTEGRDLKVSAFWRVLPQDLDPIETREWIESLNQVVETEGAEHVRADVAVYVRRLQ